MIAPALVQGLNVTFGRVRVRHLVLHVSNSPGHPNSASKGKRVFLVESVCADGHLCVVLAFNALTMGAPAHRKVINAATEAIRAVYALDTEVQ